MSEEIIPQEPNPSAKLTFWAVGLSLEKISFRHVCICIARKYHSSYKIRLKFHGFYLFLLSTVIAFLNYFHNKSYWIIFLKCILFSLKDELNHINDLFYKI